jgi:hypothetical protein
MTSLIKRLPLAALAVAVALSVGVGAQSNPQIAGNWEIDTAKSVTGRGRAGGPGPDRMIIKVSPAEVAVTSDTGVNRARETAVYKLDAPEHEVPGPLSWNSRAKSTWDSGRLVVTIARIIEGPTEPVRIEMKDVYSVSGDVLTLERTQGVQSWKSVFNRRKQ